MGHREERNHAVRDESNATRAGLSAGKERSRLPTRRGREEKESWVAVIDVVEK